MSNPKAIIMKRIEQLQKLSREHHGSLVMAKKISQIAEEGSETDLIEAIQTIKDYDENELEAHFQHEERTIFAVIFKNYKEHIPFATALLKEHGLIRMLIMQMKPETAKEDLGNFGLLLKTHTRLEEHELFPIIEKSFSDEELDAVLNFVPID